MTFSPHKIESLETYGDSVLVADMNFSGRKLSSGLILLDDNGTTSGIRPRWGRVYAIGPEQKDVEVGQYVMIAHGRWTRGIDIVDPHSDEELTIRKVDPNDILLVSDEELIDDSHSSAVQAQQQSR